MKKLKSILYSLNISEDKKEKLYLFFESRFKTQQFIYPQDISNVYGLNENLIARLFVALTNEDLLEVFTIPYDRQSNFAAVKSAIAGVLLNFEDDLEVLNEDGEPYDNASLEAVAAYRVIAE